jgi:DNA helicase-2/ATP-dependent DNA helicase PcrA
MELLDGLNPAQRQAAELGGGPILILAGPGSGKTRVITYRIAHLLLSGLASPDQVLAVTFTNKAAREMKERIARLVPGAAASLTVGTFHAVCARFLRRDGQAIGIASDFTIYDDDDQIGLVKRILKELNIDDKQFAPRAILSAISAAKSELRSPKQYAEGASSYVEEVVSRVYRLYQEKLAESHAQDFDDLLMSTVRLFKEAPNVLEKYQERYRHILVDEFQDTNIAQYTIVRLLSAKYRNICVVGDPDQCLVPGTLIASPDGLAAIDTFTEGQPVLAASGRGRTASARVLAVRKRPYSGKIIEIRTVGGRALVTTPNHMLFARLGQREDVYYVYLMYRADKGYRIGRVRGTRRTGEREAVATGLQVRVAQEHADKAWILRVCATLKEAILMESLLASRFGIPTMVFHVTGRRMEIDQADVDRLYAEIDTGTRARELMDALGLHEQYPHYRPQGIATDGWEHRRVVNLSFYANRPSNGLNVGSDLTAHRVSLNTSNESVAASIAASGLPVRVGRPSKWRMESAR